MQMSVPEVMDISKEPQRILDLYGAKPGFVSQAESAEDPRIFYKGDDPTFANNCLLARRLVENGVRFVQLYDWGWDHHGSSPGESIDERLPIKCQQPDPAIAGLLVDLERSEERRVGEQWGSWWAADHDHKRAPQFGSEIAS